MAEIVRWNPFQEMMGLRDIMNRLASESAGRAQGCQSAIQSVMDLYVSDKEYIVKLVLPGLAPDNFEITMNKNTLTIEGRTQKGEDSHIPGSRSGEFSRTIQFLTQVDTEKIQASLANGILTVRVPKSEVAKPRHITVQQPS